MLLIARPQLQCWGFLGLPFSFYRELMKTDRIQILELLRSFTEGPSLRTQQDKTNIQRLDFGGQSETYKQSRSLIPRTRTKFHTEHGCLMLKSQSVNIKL